mgnify:FL=1
MFSLCPELQAKEVETILRLTAKNIDHIEANKPFKGHYGAGMLQSGAALDLIAALYDGLGIAIIKDQIIDRWSQRLSAFNRAVILKDIAFTDEAAFELRAKNQIVLKPGTRLAPENKNGIRLTIEPEMSPR